MAMLVRAYNAGEPRGAHLRPLAPRAAPRAAGARPFWRGRAQHRHLYGGHTLPPESRHGTSQWRERGEPASPGLGPCGSQRHDCGTPLLARHIRLSLQPLPPQASTRSRSRSSPRPPRAASPLECSAAAWPKCAHARSGPRPHLGDPDAAMSTPGRESEALPRVVCAVAALWLGSAARPMSPGREPPPC